MGGARRQVQGAGRMEKSIDGVKGLKRQNYAGGQDLLPEDPTAHSLFPTLFPSRASGVGWAKGLSPCPSEQFNDPQLG